MSVITVPAQGAIFSCRAEEKHIVLAFLKHGYVILRGAFEPDYARSVMWETLRAQVEARCAQTGLRPPERLDDAEFWGKEAPVLRPGLALPLEEVSPWAARVVDLLVGGAPLARPLLLGERWVLNSKTYAPERLKAQTLRINWHVDSPEPGTGPAHLGRSDEPLLLMAYWSDVPKHAGGTLFCPAALSEQLELIARNPDGVDPYVDDWGWDIFSKGQHPYFEFLGSAGDLLICHALTLHSAQPRTVPDPIRVLENAVVKLREPLDLRPDNPNPTPAEELTIRRLKPSASLARHLRWAAPPTSPVPAHCTPAPLRIRLPRAVEDPLRRSLGQVEMLLDTHGVLLRVRREGRAILTLELRERGEWSAHARPGGRVSREKAAAAAARVTQVLRHLSRVASQEMETLYGWHASAEKDVLAATEESASSPLERAATGEVIEFLEGALQSRDPMVQAVAHGLRGDREAALRCASRYISEGAPAGATPTEAELRLLLCLKRAAGSPEDIRDALLATARASGGEEGARLLFVAGNEAARSGQYSSAWMCLHEATQLDVSAPALGSAARLATAVDGFDEALELAGRALALDPNEKAALQVLTEDALARGAYGAALAYAQRLREHHPEVAAGALGVGAALIGLGRPDEALEPLERAIALAPRESAPHLWLALLAYRAGDLAKAREHQSAVASHANRAQSLVRVLVSAGNPPDRAKRLRDPAIRDNMYSGIFNDTLPAWTSHEEVEAALQSEAALDEFTLGLLARMHGNLSEPLTLFDAVDGETAGQRKPLKRWVSPRNRASDVLKKLRYAPPEEVERELEVLEAECAISPHPSCYLGELLLWQGRYDDALAAFERGRERFPARWSFVGSAAAHYLRGDPAEAERELKACAERYEPLESATTSVYVGEFERRAGNLKAARAHLAQAIRSKPSRHAARMNLALIDAAEGDADAFQEHWAAFWRVLPGLLFDATSALGLEGRDRWAIRSAPEVLESALGLMRGNRSSTLVTYVAEDVFRVAPLVSDWAEVARAGLRFAQERSGKPPSLRGRAPRAQASRRGTDAPSRELTG